MKNGKEKMKEWAPKVVFILPTPSVHETFSEKGKEGNWGPWVKCIIFSKMMDSPEHFCSKPQGPEFLFVRLLIIQPRGRHLRIRRSYIDRLKCRGVGVSGRSCPRKITYRKKTETKEVRKIWPSAGPLRSITASASVSKYIVYSAKSCGLATMPL